MLNSRAFQSLICIGLGAMLGLAVAATRFDPLRRAAANPPVIESPEDPSTANPLDLATKKPCCQDGQSKELLLAQVDENKVGAKPATRASASGKKPNIVVIMGDDIGVWNIGAYHRGMMAGRPISTNWPPKACYSPTITRRRAARPAAPTSSPGNCRSARA